MKPGNKQTLRVEYHGTRKDTHSNVERPAASIERNKFPRGGFNPMEIYTFYRHEQVKDRMGSLFSIHGEVEAKKPWSLEIEITALEPSPLSLKTTLDFCRVCSSFAEPAALEKSRDNCGTCDFLWRIFESCIPSDRLESFPKEEISCSLNTHGWPLAWYVRWAGNVLAQAEIDLVADACDIPNRGHMLGSCEEELGIVFDWLQDCNCGHDGPTEPYYMPTRLLEIKGSQSLPSVRLRDSKDILSTQGVANYRYTTLSHCWGPEGSPRFKTTPQNISERKEKIKWAEIPHTFQDAILFTYRLGVCYLWIDSLCIIQDEEDFKDWQAESAQMSNVYSRSYLNIAAVSAAHANVGLFRELPATTLARPSLSVQSSTASGSLLLYAKVQNSYEIKPARPYPLLLRAWALQERYLSPRSILFFDNELVWLCNSGIWKQGSDGSLPTCYGKYCDYMQTEEITHVQTRWLSCVDEYSKLELTFEKDRLPAIGGIAAHLQQYRSGQYYAGIWTDSLCFDLCWIGEPGAKFAVKGAPSWSWASVLTPVSYLFMPMDYTSRMIVTLVDIHCDYLGANLMGEVSGGYMQLRGPYLQLPDIQWKYSGFMWGYYDYPKGEVDDGKEWNALEDSAAWSLCSTHAIRCMNSSEYDIDLSSDNIILLQLCETWFTDIDDSNMWILHLILRKLGPDGMYERVGFATYKRPKREENAALGDETLEQTGGIYQNPGFVLQPEILVTIV